MTPCNYHVIIIEQSTGKGLKNMQEQIDLTKLSRDYSKNPWKNGETAKYDDFHYLYVELNWSAKEIQEYMGIKSACLSRTLRNLGIYKPKSKTLSVRKRLNQEQFGSNSPFGNSEIYKKGRETCSTRYGSENYKQQHIKNTENLNADYWYEHFVKKGMFLAAECAKYHNMCERSVKLYKAKFRIWEPNKPVNRPEQQICSFLYSLGVQFKMHDRDVLGNLELDFFIPDFNLAIEFDGLLYHSIDGQFSKTGGVDDLGDKQVRKTQLCNEKGITLLKIFEDEWADKDLQEAWKSKIARALNKHACCAPADKLVMSRIDKDLADTFLFVHGLVPDDKKFGDYYGLFGKNFELLHVFVVEDINPELCVLTASVSRSDVYIEDLPSVFPKFGLDKPLKVALDARTTLPNEIDDLNKHHYYVMEHIPPRKYFFRKDQIPRGRIAEPFISLVREHKLKLAEDNNNISDEQQLLDHGYFRIYDCGEYLFVNEDD